MQVTKEFKFDMSHMLAGHPGLCKNLHGHTYKLEVTVGGDILSKGMVIDFKDLKNIVNGLVVDKCDHAFMYNQSSTDDAEHEIARVLNKHHKKVVKTNFRPTAENMVIWIFGVLLHDGDLNIKKVRLYETPTSYAEVTLSGLAGADERAYTAE